MKPIEWKVIAQEGAARAGILRTRRSVIETPVFMPVGTQGTVKGVRFEWLEDEMDARIILGNTYHLFLRPGAETIRQLGGLHKFTTWNRSFLTDSGGFQVFSLTDLRKLNEDGVEFRSHLNGDKKFLSPEISMEIQAALGSEIVMVFDECLPGAAGIEATRKSLEMTARWAQRSRDKFDALQDALQNDGMDTGFVENALFGAEEKFSEAPENFSGAQNDFSELSEPFSEAQKHSSDAQKHSGEAPQSFSAAEKRFNEPEKHPPLMEETREISELSGRQALFGIVQGAGHLDLRKESLDRTTEIGFDGYAIGGLSVGEEKSVMYDVVEFLAPQMPNDAPRYLMGVGTPEDLIEAVYRGVDMFDCVMPTRNGRTGSVFTSRGKINIRNAQYTTDDTPLDAECPCSVCRRYSKAYLRHLYQSKEMLAATLLSHHNLAFYLNLMRQVRDAIKRGTFGAFRREFLRKIGDN